MFALAYMGRKSRGEAPSNAFTLHGSDFFALSLIPSTQLERYRHTCFAQFITVASVL